MYYIVIEVKTGEIQGAYTRCLSGNYTKWCFDSPKEARRADVNDRYDSRKFRIDKYSSAKILLEKDCDKNDPHPNWPSLEEFIESERQEERIKKEIDERDLSGFAAVDYHLKQIFFIELGKYNK